MRESDFHKLFYEHVKDDFYTAHEVPGTCFLNHPNAPQLGVRADFLLYPRRHLLEAGFADTWFAVELKPDRFHLEDALRQAFWHNMSQFDLGEKKITPGFALGCIPYRDPFIWRLRESDSLTLLQKKEAQIRHEVSNEFYNKGLLASFGYLNTGQLIVREAHKNKAQPLSNKWVIRFYGHNRYASRKFNEDFSVNSRQDKGFTIRAGATRGMVTHSGRFGDGLTNLGGAA